MKILSRTLVYGFLAVLLLGSVNLAGEEKKTSDKDKSKESPVQTEKKSDEAEKPAQQKPEEQTTKLPAPSNKKEAELVLETKLTFPAISDDEGISLSEIMDYISLSSGLNIIVAGIKPTEIMIKIQFKSFIKIKDALKLILSPDNDYLVDKDGLVIITTWPKVFESRLETRTYDILDLIIEVPDFVAPDIGLAPAQQPPQPNSTPRVKPDELLALIKDYLGKRYGGFDQNKAPGTLAEFKSPFLIVRHRPEVHAEVEQLLNLLR